MTDESKNTKRKPQGKFWQGLLISLAGWILDAGLTTLVFSWGTFNRNLGWEHFKIEGTTLIPFGIALVVIWLPVAVIAGFIARKSGLKSTLPLVIVTGLVAPVVFGCGFGMLIYL